MNVAQSLLSRAVSAVLAIAIVLTGIVHTTPAWAVTVTAATPTISGSAGVGSTLTVEEGTWDPVDTAFTYQWTRDDVAIDGATSATYTTALADIGAAIKVVVTGSADGFDSDSATSSNTITPVLNTFSTTTNPTISGTKKVGSTLTAAVSGWSPSSGVTYTYQWRRTVDSVTTDITDATDSTYTLVADDEGATISVAVEGSKSGYTSVTTTSAETSAIAANTFTTVGTPVVGMTTTAIGDLVTVTEGTWAPSTDVTYTYQWQRKVGATTSDIDSETDSTYALAVDDMGNSVRVVVTAHLSGYADTESTSAWAAIPLLSFATTGQPTVTGENVSGGELTVDPSGVFDPSLGTTYTYRWFKDGVVIGSETTDTYTVRSGDVGAEITAEVTAHADGYDDETVVSTGTTVVAASKYTLTPRPTISGLPQVGKTLTVVTGTWTPTPTTLDVQWLRDGVAIDGATDDTYDLVGADAGSLISVTVTARKSMYEVKSRTSVATSAVLLGVFSIKPTPTISGTERVGATLTANTGSWTPTCDAFTYQWLRDGVAISGATSSTYALVAADRGTFVSVRVTPNMTGYATPTRTSATTGAIGLGVLSTATPTISGVVAIGNELTAAPGSWTSGTSFTYQWKRAGVAITGATNATYTVVGADAGARLSVTVTGTKTAYSAAISTSANTIVVPASEFTGGQTPVIEGDAQVGSTLSVDFGTLSPTPTGVTYLWTSDGVSVGTGATYTLTVDDLDAAIVVSVTATAVGYTPWESGESDPVVVDYGSIEMLTAPTVLGTARLGRVLTGTTGTWRHQPDSFDYQWYADGEAIADADGIQYSPVEGDVGAILAFEVTAHKAGFTDEVALSSVTTEVRYAAFNLQPVPSITGTTKVNNVLTAVTGSWSPTPEGFDYQWTRNGTPISGATSGTYTLVGADAGTLIRVVVTGVHAGYEGDPKTSLPTAAISAGTFSSKPVPTLDDTTPVVGQTLTATAPTWTPAQDSFTYTWSRTASGTTTVISGATSATYEVVAADLGATLTVTVTGTLDGYTTASAMSAASSAVAAGSFSVSPIPTISGTVKVGEILTASVAAWTPTATFAYQWKRDGSIISGAQSSTYRLQPADADAAITVAVTGARTAYSSITRTSAATVDVEPLVFEDIITPTIDGEEAVGKTLRASTGTWTPSQDRFEYQWLCDDDPITGATSATYVPAGNEAGCVITVEVTGVKLGYRSVTLTSAPTTALDLGTFVTTPTPTISGIVAVGKLLTATPGTWVPSAELDYQWTRDGEDIVGETDSTYRLTADDLDAVIGVYVLGTKLGYYDSNYIASDETDPVVEGTINPAPAPTISGTAQVGRTLTSSIGTWGDEGEVVDLEYQWKRTLGGVTEEIDGANDDTYQLTADDLGASVKLTVTGTMTAFTDQVKSSNATVAVVKGTFGATHLPAITGTVAVGKTLTVSMGDWSPNDPTFVYQWYVGKLPVSGATSATYVPLATDLGKKIWVAVTANEPGYVSVSGVSAKSLVAMGSFDTAPTPTISTGGTYTVGATLTANPGTWAPGAPGTTLAYQWFRGGVAIAGQTAATYTLQGGDAGTTVTVAVTATRSGFATQTKTSAATATIASADFTSTPTPIINYPVADPPKVGEILSVNIGDWAPLQFPLWTPTAGRISYAYQWYRGDSVISDATRSTYQLVADDRGFTIKVSVTASLLGYTTTTKTSAASQAVDTGAFSPSPNPTISGTRTVGSTLTANTGTWGPVTPSFTYQWKRDDLEISGAESSTYVLTPADLDHAISVTIRATSPAFAPANRTSAATPLIENGTFTAGTPTIRGTMGVGSTITAVTGTWAPSPDLIEFRYQWLKNGQVITGATNATFTPVAADVGTYYSVRVTATREGFTSSAAVSGSRLVVKGTFSNTVKPAITGTLAVGQDLTVTTGTWTPVAAGATYAYKWFRGTTAISGATASTYRTVSGDAGKKISVQVTISAPGYNSASVKSAASTIP